MMASQLASNTDQTRCDCGRFISEGMVVYSRTAVYWQCGRCGTRRRYVGGNN